LAEYHSSRILLRVKQLEVDDMQRDLDLLEADLKLMQSSNEYEKIPYIVEAIDYCKKEV
jgi:hypothetical protein